MTGRIYVQDTDVTLWHGDAIGCLRELPAGSIDCCVTSPPYYALRDYGAEGQVGLEETPAAYVDSLVNVFREVWRVLADHGTVFLNLGDSYASKTKGSGGMGSSTLGVASGGNAISDAGIDRSQERQQMNLRRFNHDVKDKDLMGIPWRVAFALQDDGWYLRSDIIWCLSGGTRLYARTQRGEGHAMLRDLVRLDPSTVQLWNGEKWTQVLGWSETPRGETLEIELASGERIGCTPTHRWPTQRGVIRADELTIGDVIETCRLPEPASPESPSLVPDEIGWLIGLYIAEGSRSGSTIQIAGHVNERERFARLCQIAESYGATCAMHETHGNAATINLSGKAINGIIDQYVDGRTAHDKHLRPRCWRRSNTFLRHVLDGYLDGDGHYEVKNDRWRLGFCRNDALAADLRTIAARLGMPLRLSRIRVGWKGQIRMSWNTHHNARRDGKIVAIRKSRARRFYEVGVADEPHLFALASGVLTHNSKPNPMPESITDRPTKSHEYVFLLTKRASYFYDQEPIREPFSSLRGSGNIARKYGEDVGAPNPGGVGRSIPWQPSGPVEVPQEETLGDLPGEAPRGADGRRQTSVRAGENSEQHRDGERWPNPGGANARTVWTITPESTPFKHFATMPQELARRCILAGSSAYGVCVECGKPWERQLGEAVLKGEKKIHGSRPAADERNVSAGGLARSNGRTWREREDLGWAPTCECDADVRPAVVLDPFGGSGTTGLVARNHGRHAVLIELNAEYCELASSRLAQLSLLS